MKKLTPLFLSLFCIHAFETTCLAGDDPSDPALSSSTPSSTHSTSELETQKEPPESEAKVPSETTWNKVPEAVKKVVYEYLPSSEERDMLLFGRTHRWLDGPEDGLASYIHNRSF